MTETPLIELISDKSTGANTPSVRIVNREEWFALTKAERIAHIQKWRQNLETIEAMIKVFVIDGR